jgi:hypothetical protein
VTKFESRRSKDLAAFSVYALEFAMSIPQLATGIVICVLLLAVLLIRSVVRFLQQD